MGSKQSTHVRVWRATLDSTSAIMLRPDALTLKGGEDNFIHLTEQGVSIVASKLNITTDPMNISKGVLFREQLGYLQMLPSSCVMPIAGCTINIPGTGMLAGIGKNLTVLASATAFG